jgi:hypothetical protein
MRWVVMQSVLLFATLECGAQGLVVRTSTIPGVEITGPQSPNFGSMVAQVVGTNQPGGLLAWLPYGIVIQNNTSQDIVGIALAWYGSLHGEPLHCMLADLSGSFDSPSRQVQPGKVVVVLPQATLQSPRDLRQFQDGRGMGNLQNFQIAQQPEVGVDGVVFASGQYVGADELKEYEEWEAQINVPRSVAATILKNQTSNVPVSDTVAWLQTLVQAPRGGDDFDSRQAARTARAMLNAYSNHGEERLYSLAQGTLHAQPFPLHR